MVLHLNGYSNFHDENLDWLLDEMRDMVDRIENYVSELGIKYADPFDWSITSQYEQNTLVIDPASGTAYLSLKPVPAGINITNTDYWTPVFTLGELIEGIREGTAEAVEETNYATEPYAAGRLIWVDKQLVRAKTAISAGSTFNTGAGGNCEIISVEDIINEIKSALTTVQSQAAENADDITDLNTTVGAHTSALTTLNNRMGTAENNISTNAADIANIQGQIGAIIQQRKFLLVGDSYAEGYTPDGMVTGWPVLFRNFMGLNENNCIITFRGGAGFTPSGNTFNDLLTAVGADEAITDIVICGGWNDRTETLENILSAFATVKNTINTLFPNAKTYIGFIGRSNKQQKPSTTSACKSYIKASSQNNFHYLNNVEFSLYAQYEFFSSDGIHPNQSGENSIAEAVSQAVRTGSADVKGTFTSLSITPSGSGSAFGSLNGVGEVLDNGNVTIMNNALLEITVSNASQTANGHTFTELGTITNGYITGDGFHHVVWPVNAVVNNNGQFYTVPCLFKIENQKLLFALCNTNDSHTNYASYGSIRQLQIQPFCATFTTLLA